MEAVSEDGEVVSIAEAAKSILPPKYWTRAEGIIEGNPGPEYEQSYLKAQKEIGPILETDADNTFNKSKYTSLPYLLSKVIPIANDHGLTLKQGCGRLLSHGGFDNPKRTLLLPVWTQVRHAATGQWERVYIEMPLAKIDPQGFGSALSYGRRYVLQAFWSIAGTDDDGVLASRKPRLDADPVDEAIAGMLEQIAECTTAEGLKAWQERNRQGFDLLEEGAITKLREAYTKHLTSLRAMAQLEAKLKITKAADAGN
jgi:ERF superfamily